MIKRPNSSGGALISNLFKQEFPTFVQKAADSDADYAYATGNNLFDSATGTVIKDKHNKFHLMGGFYPRMATVVGESGVGKTTQELQLAAGVVENYNGQLYFLDAEGNTQKNRIQGLTGWNDAQYAQYCTYVGGDITVLDVYNLIRKIAYFKEKNKKAMTFEIPILDSSGNNRRVYTPSVVFVDSIPSLTLLKDAEEELVIKKEYKDLLTLGSNIDGAREAKDNTSFIKKMKPYLAKYGIILISINHISKEMPMSMFDHPKKHHPNLKAGEKVKGGKEWIFQSFIMPRHDIKEAINDRNRIFGERIDGGIVNFSLIKNKSNTSGAPNRVIFDKSTGWRSELTDFEYIYQAKYGFSGSPARMCLDILPSVGFTRKTLLDICETNPLFARCLRFTAKIKLMADMIYRNDTTPWNFDIKLIGDKWKIHEVASLVFSSVTPYPFYANKGFDTYDVGVYNKIYKFGQITTGIDPVKDDLSVADPRVAMLVYASIQSVCGKYVVDLKDRGVSIYDKDWRSQCMSVDQLKNGIASKSKK